MISIILDPSDEQRAADYGYRRTIENDSKQDQSVQKVNLHESIARDSEGVGAEMALAKYIGKSDFEPTVNTFKDEPDIDWNGLPIEVKWTKYVAGQLIVHEYDRTTDIAVLVTGKSPHYFIAGWIPVAIAKKPRYRHSKQPNWWVTQINLQPIENLRKSTYGQTAI
jgi:hypothetical protein